MRPKNGPSVNGLCPNSGVVVLPIRMAPAARARATATASAAGTVSANSAQPCVVATPSVLVRSLTENGMPWSGPSGAPRMTAASAVFASSRARSAQTAMKALRSRRSSMRASAASTASTGEIVFVRIAAARSRRRKIGDGSHGGSLSDHPAAAIDQERLAGDIACLFAREEGDTAGDILRLRDESGRRRRLDPLDHGGRQPVMRAGPDGAGRDRVDGDAECGASSRASERVKPMTPILAAA